MDEDIDVVDWEVDENENIYDDEPILAPPRFIENLNPDVGYGLLDTVIEGKEGERMKNIAKRNRTDEEKTRDNINLLASQLSIDSKPLLRELDRIPDIRFKSPSGLLFGYLAINYIGKELNNVEKERLDAIFLKLKEIKIKTFVINEMDVIRYARALKKWLK